MTVPNQPAQPQPGEAPPLPPPPAAKVQTFTHHPQPPRRQPGRHRFVFPVLVLLILSGGLVLGVLLVSNQKESREVRAPAITSPPRTTCNLQVTSSESIEPGRYTLNATATYTGRQESVQLTYYWAKCRCQEGGGNQTQRGKPICKGNWPDDPGECAIGQQQTRSLNRNEPLTISETVSQYQDRDCGSYQLDFVVVDVSGEVCNQNVPAYGFYPTGQNCQVQTPTPTPTATPTPTPRPPTPTPTPPPGQTPTPTPTPKLKCQDRCDHSSECEGSLICDDHKCLNAQCKGELDCLCPGQTPTPTPTAAPPSVEKETKLPPASGGLGIIETLLNFFKNLIGAG